MATVVFVEKKPGASIYIIMIIEANASRFLPASAIQTSRGCQNRRAVYSCNTAKPVVYSRACESSNRNRSFIAVDIVLGTKNYFLVCYKFEI